MWRNSYDLSGVKLEEGLEVIASGFPEIYLPSGRLSLKASTLELVGEGALKKAYEELKIKLQEEGLFDSAKKKTLTDFPQRIGLITSKNGAVIHDFQSNIGAFGYQIKFIDSRVEGQLAVRDLVSAVKTFKKEPLDALVIIRGGGSLESLQAFNNESLIRTCAKLPFPLICGIGHDQDVPLLSLSADLAVSTPTAVTKVLNQSWEQALSTFTLFETELMKNYQKILQETELMLVQSSEKIKNYYATLWEKLERQSQKLQQNLARIESSLKVIYSFQENLLRKITTRWQTELQRITTFLGNSQKILENNNPERQLKLGYSITTTQGKVIKNASKLKTKDLLTTQFQKGKIVSRVEKTCKE